MPDFILGHLADLEPALESLCVCLEAASEEGVNPEWIKHGREPMRLALPANGNSPEEEPTPVRGPDPGAAVVPDAPSAGIYTAGIIPDNIAPEEEPKPLTDRAAAIQDVTCSQEPTTGPEPIPASCPPSLAPDHFRPAHPARLDTPALLRFLAESMEVSYDLFAGRTRSEVAEYVRQDLMAMTINAADDQAPFRIMAGVACLIPR